MIQLTEASQKLQTPSKRMIGWEEVLVHRRQRVSCVRLRSLTRLRTGTLSGALRGEALRRDQDVADPSRRVDGAHDPPGSPVPIPRRCGLISRAASCVSYTLTDVTRAPHRSHRPSSMMTKPSISESRAKSSRTRRNPPRRSGVCLVGADYQVHATRPPARSGGTVPMIARFFAPHSMATRFDLRQPPSSRRR